MKNLEKEIYEMDILLKLDPKKSSDLFKRANLFFQNCEYEKAIADYTEIINLDRENCPIYEFWGNMINLYPDFASVYNCRAEAYLSYGDKDKAIEDFKKAYKEWQIIHNAFLNYIKQECSLDCKSAKHRISVATTKAPNIILSEE